jgi:hypothetical protein
VYGVAVEGQHGLVSVHCLACDSSLMTI